MEGTNLNGLNASDLTAALTYRSSRETPVAIKANGATVSQTTASDKAVTGANYTHTFKVSNLAFDTQLGTTADLSFVINTKGMSVNDFPTEFLIELNGVSENVIGGSFVCSEYFAFETASLNENMFSIAYDLAGGNLEEGVSNPTAYGEASETFTLNNPVKSGNTFAGWTGTGLEEATMEVTIVKGSTGDRSYVASWTEPVSILTFTLAEDVTLELKRCGDTDMFMGTYEITQEQYSAIMRTNPSANNGGATTASCPVECVSWNDIMTENTGFMAKINASLTAQLTAKGLSDYQFALPTQSKWKTACEAGSTTEDSDDKVNDRAWYKGNSNKSTHVVGGKSPNAWGLYDMRGNVWEWTSSWG